MPDFTSPGGIVYPLPTDPIAPLNAVFQDLAESAQDAIGRAAINVPAYRLVQQIVYETPGTVNFQKADYPWLRAIRVKCQGGGGGGGSADGSGSGQSAGGGGGGGGYAESFITDIAGLNETVVITVGAGGTTAPTSGTASSFGALVSGAGGGPGESSPTRTTGTALRTSGLGGQGSGDFVVTGSDGGTAAVVGGTSIMTGVGGASFLGQTRVQIGNGAIGPSPFGSGGAGGHTSSSTSQNGGNGSKGIVILELYA
jgi:hypothetical protein